MSPSFVDRATALLSGATASRRSLAGKHLLTEDHVPARGADGELPRGEDERELRPRTASPDCIYWPMRGAVIASTVS